MSDEKKPLGKVLPDDKKDNKDKYPDSLKSPLHKIEDKRETLKKAHNEEE